MVIDLTKLRFYVLKSEDLKGDDTTETAKCTVAPFQQEKVDTAQDGDLLTTVTCNFAANGTSPAGKDTFRLIKSGTNIRLENSARENLTVVIPGGISPSEFDPAALPHVLIQQIPSASGTPYQVRPYSTKTVIEMQLKAEKHKLRTTRKDVDFPIGPWFSLEVGGFHLRGMEVDLPSVRDPLLGTTLERYAADAFSPDPLGFALDATLHYAFLGQKEDDYGWLGTVLDSVAGVGLRLRISTLSANDTVSGIPGERSKLSYLQGGLFWRLGLSTQSITRAAVSDFHKSDFARWDLGFHYETPLIEGERFHGTFPWGGLSLAEAAKALDVSNRLTVGDSNALNFSASYCFEKGGQWAPCLGLTYKYQFGRRFDAGDFYFNMDPQHDLQFSISFLNAVKTEFTDVTDPYDVIVNDVPEPVVLPPTPPAPTIQADPPPPPPAMTPVPPPQRLSLEIKGAEANFRVGSAALLPGTKQTIEGKMVHPIGDFWQKLMAQGYSPSTTLYINVGGFASSEGRFENNLRLSGNRAGSVQGYLRTRFSQLNETAWRADKKADPKLQRNAWTPPYPDPRNVVFQVRGYGETEPICKPGKATCVPPNDRAASPDEDVMNSRRFVAGVFTDANEAATAMKPGPVSAVTATGDGQRAETIATMFRAAGFKAGFDTTTSMLLVTLPVSWKDPKPDAKGAAVLRKLASTITKAAKHFKGMSRAVSLKIGMIAEPTADETVELQRIETVKEMLYGRKQFASWPVNGPTDIIPVPAGLADPMSHLVQEAAKPVGSVLVDATTAAQLLGAKVKNVTIGGTSAKLYALPIKLDPKGNPAPEMMVMAAAIGQTMKPGEWLTASLYRHTSATFDVKNVLQKLYARLTDAHRQQHTVPSVDPNHFTMDQSKDALPDKATQLYIVVSDTEIPRQKIVQKLFDLAIPQQP